MNNNNVLPLFVFVLFFLVINLLGVSYLCFKEYNRQDVRTEVIGVQNQLQEMGMFQYLQELQKHVSDEVIINGQFQILDSQGRFVNYL